MVDDRDLRPSTSQSDEASAPASVQSMVQEWRTRGRPGQPPICWPRDRWVAAFPARASVFERLPVRLDREVVRTAVRHALDLDDAIGAFLPCVAWGFGRVGYGPFRVSRMLGAGDADSKLAAVAEIAAAGRPVDAYRLLGGASRLDQLGPAFGTKFLYFVDRRGLILDRVIARCLVRMSDLRFDPARWDPAGYQRYLDVLASWSGELGLQADELEHVLFTDEARRTGSQWGSR
ncbi:MAG: hypothetical protein ACR2K6_08810 [Solirubrobacterales bacterium]